MNILHSSDSRFKFMKENSILSFNAAAKFPVDFIEFDVQVRGFFFCFFNVYYFIIVNSICWLPSNGCGMFL